MTIVNDLIDEQTALATARLPWETYWRAVAMYVLPQTEGFDRLLTTNQDAAITSVVSTPVAAQRSKDLYDMTSLWGIERLTAGLLSLKTPETEPWHGLGFNDMFGAEPSYEEREALERLRDYMFRVRANPKSGFWSAHRAALKSMCAFGDGWMYTEEVTGGGARTPYRFEYCPLPELYPGVDSTGVTDRMFKVSRFSAIQIATRWGADKVGAKVVEYANDVKKRHETFRVMHGVRPRTDALRGRLGVRGAAFASYYVLPDEKHMIGEGGYYEFPYHRYAWSNTGQRPFSEGPVAYALGELKSLNEMAKNELIASQSFLRPAMAVANKNMTRLNFNPGHANPGLITPDGKPMFAPLTSGQRPDFAREIMAARRESARELLYLNLWQVLLADKATDQETATKSLIKAQEKGELLGPVGISLNEGLSVMTDREIGILGRKRAFEAGSPLEMPDSLADRNVSPIFNSPLDRLRRMGELVGIQRLAEFAIMLAGGDPQRGADIMARFDIDEMLERAQEILGAPVKTLRDRDAAQEDRDGSNQMNQLAQTMMMMQQGGEAARSIGEGGQAMAAGAEVASRSPALQNLFSQAGPLSGVAPSGRQVMPV